MDQELKKIGAEITGIDVTNQIRKIMEANNVTDFSDFESALSVQNISFGSFYTFNKRQAISQQFANKLVLFPPPLKVNCNPITIAIKCNFKLLIPSSVHK